MAGLVSVIGTVDNESFHPFGRSHIPISFLLAAACITSIGVALAELGERTDPADGNVTTRVAVHGDV